MRVFVLCGGQGTRLAPVLGGVPKALAPIHGRPFLDDQLEALHQAGFVDLVLCTGVGHDQIAAHVRSCWGTTIQCSHEPTPRGTAGALRYARGWVQDTVLVVNGDTFVTADYHAMNNHNCVGVIWIGIIRLLCSANNWTERMDRFRDVLSRPALCGFRS